MASPNVDVQAPRKPAASLASWGRALRPHQWVKNFLVFGALIFSRSLFDPAAIWNSGLAFVAFCCASGAAYLWNDLRDAASDREHPVKRLRPIASGEISLPAAGAAMAVLAVTGVLVSLALPPAFQAALGAYLALNAGYSLGLKRVVILDVMLVAMGFVLRAVAGAAAIEVEASPWLILCTLMLSLLVSFGKRRQELHLMGGGAGNHRATLKEYSVATLEMMMTVSAGAAIVCYSLYTMADETGARFGSTNLVYTTPIVLFAVFRYLLRVFQHREGGDPARLLLSDRPLLIAVLVWLAAVCVIVYRPLASGGQR